MTAENDLLKRITARPDVFGGKPIIRGMRVAVEHILGMLTAGETAQVILQEYPFLEPSEGTLIAVMQRRMRIRRRERAEGSGA